MSASFEEFKKVCKKRDGIVCLHDITLFKDCNKNICPYLKYCEKIDKEHPLGTPMIFKPQPAPEPVPLYEGYLTPDELLKAISNYKKEKVVRKGFINVFGFGGEHYRCPTCGNSYLIGCPEYCEDCGQHLDWGEDE